jgi:hypothetical protein
MDFTARLTLRITRKNAGMLIGEKIIKQSLAQNLFQIQ